MARNEAMQATAQLVVTEVADIGGGIGTAARYLSDGGTLEAPAAYRVLAEIAERRYMLADEAEESPIARRAVNACLVIESAIMIGMAKTVAEIDAHAQDAVDRWAQYR